MEHTKERVPAKGCNGPYEINRLGEVFSVRMGRKLKLRFDKDGYLYFTDACNGVNRNRKVHQIMLLSFDVPNPENKPTVNHKNGDKTDNRLENLEWMTQQEQIAHAIHVLGIKIGSHKGRPRPNGSGVPPRPVRGTHLKTGEQREFESIREAARQVGGHNTNIYAACQGKYKYACGHRWEYVDN